MKSSRLLRERATVSAYRVVENSNGDLEVGIEDAGDVLLAAYPTENENDLVRGRCERRAD